MTPEKMVLLEVAGFLNLIAQGMVPPNSSEQAKELLEKVGRVLSGADHG